MENNTNDDKFLKYICVEGLNGFLKHEIALKESGITIIHGPNGCGKTTLLDMIMYFYNKDYTSLAKVDFKDFILIHSNSKNEDTVIKIKKVRYLKNEIENFEIRNSKYKNAKKYFLNEIEHRFFEYNRDFISIYLSVDDKKDEFIMAIPLNESGLDLGSIDDRNIRNKIIHDRIRLQQNGLFDEYDPFNDIDIYRSKKMASLYFRNANTLDQYADLFEFFMVKTQRLIYLPTEDDNSKKNSSRYMIERYAKDLAQKIATSLAESNEKTASHDKSFPERLIQNIKSISTSQESENNIRQKYKETQDKITKILNAGLLFREKNISLPDDGLNNENVKTVLSLYLQDLNEKLAVYDDLLNKIENFQEIVGNKINNKDLHIQYDKGFYFTSKYGDKKELKLSELSSGEQHQIVLFYELIFLAKTGTYYLIDEPEISLHVDWQRSFLDDISRVEKLRGHKFIIATHSPQIIGSKRSLCVALDGGIL